MKWKEFACKIDGKYEDQSTGFIIGDSNNKLISKDDGLEKVKIQKRVRRAYGQSSDFNHEKLEFEWCVRGVEFGKNRITKKDKSGKYEIKDESYGFTGQILNSQELEYLMSYPKSELILLKNSIWFKCKSQGEIKEDLGEIYKSIEILKNTIVSLAKQ